MSAVRTTCWRTVGRLRNLYLTAFAVGGFLLSARGESAQDHERRKNERQ